MPSEDIFLQRLFSLNKRYNDDISHIELDQIILIQETVIEFSC